MMGKRNVVLWDGTVVSIDEDTAKRLNPGLNRTEGPTAEAARTQAERRTDENSSVTDKLLTGYEGAMDTLTLGGFGKLAEAADRPDQRSVEKMRARAQENPGSHFIGSAAAFFLPGAELAAPGLAAKAGRAVSEGAAGQRLIEGALLGAGAHVAHTNVTGDPLTIEGTLESAGIGSVLNYGFGATADALRGLGSRAKQSAAEAAALKADVETAKTGAKLFKETPDSWKAFAEAHGAAQDAAAELRDAALDNNEAFQKFVSEPKNVNSAIKGFRSAQNELRSRVQNSVFGTSSVAEADAQVQPQLMDAMADLRKTTDAAALAARKGDAEGAVTILRGAASRVRSIAPDLELPALPAPLVRSIPAVEEVTVAKDLRGFLKQRSDTVARIAKSLDPSSEAALGRVVEDLGVQPGATASETLDAIHTRLGEYQGAIDRLVAKTPEDAPKGLIGWARTFAKKAARYAAARALDVGGPLGAVTRTAGGEIAGHAMNGVEDTLLGATLVQGKEGIKEKVRDIFANYAPKAGAAVGKMAPVVSYLANSFPDGKKDPATDIREQAANRIGELIAAKSAAPDTLFQILDGAMGHPADVAWKLHNKMVTAIAHLADSAPRDPGTDVAMFRSNWLPSYDEAIALAHRIEAVLKPMMSIARTLAGDGHPAATETRNTVWPALMQETINECSLNAPAFANLTQLRADAFSSLWGVPMAGPSEPAVTMALQSIYLPPAQKNQQQQQARPVGRPAAVQSKVAGSSVSGLISQ